MNRLGRRLAKHKNVSFGEMAYDQQSSASSESGIGGGGGEVAAAASNQCFGQDGDGRAEDVAPGFFSSKIKFIIILALSSIAGWYVWNKSTKNEVENARKYGLITAGVVAVILGYLLFVKKIIG